MIVAHFGGLGCYKLTGPKKIKKVGGIQLTRERTINLMAKGDRWLGDCETREKTIIIANWEICATHWYIYLVIHQPSNVPFHMATKKTQDDKIE